MYPTDRLIRTPLHQQPITIVLKSIRQKVFRKVHCMECGMPFGEITDKVLMVYDGEVPVEQYAPDRFGLIEAHCPRHTCKQYYRWELAV